MKKILAAFFIGICLSAAAYADSTTTRLGLVKPTIGSTGWGTKLDNNYDTIDLGVAVLGVYNNFTSSAVFTSTVNFLGNGVFFSTTTAASPTMRIVSSGGAGQVELGFYGQYFPGSIRTAIDLIPPIQNTGNGFPAELTIYGDASVSGSTYSRVNFGWASAQGDAYNFLSIESSGTGKNRSGEAMNADHGTGVNRVSMYVVGNNNRSQGQFGAVIMGNFAQKTNETVTDQTPINMLVLRPPDDFAAAGKVDSHAFDLVGVSSDATGAHRAYWQQHVNTTSNAGASTWILGHQIIPGSSSTTDNGPTAISTAIAVTDGNIVQIASGITVNTADFNVTAGNTGIGISAPVDAKLQIVGTANTYALSVSTSGTGSPVAFGVTNVGNVTANGSVTLSSGVVLANSASIVTNGALSYNQTATQLDLGNGTTTQIIQMGAWSTWTPTLTGFSGSPTVTLARYARIGKTVIIMASFTGTSNATTMSMTLPIASSSTFSCPVPGGGVDNGTRITTMPRVDLTASSATANIFADNSGSTWTNSGTKAMALYMTYEGI